MKKIDLHIHTKSSISDTSFTFDLDNLKKYVSSLNLAAIAITNHNLFDKDQFDQIRENLSDVIVFPGVEIDLEKGHLLLIAEYKDVEKFKEQCDKLNLEIKTQNDSLTYDKFVEIFDNYSNYLLIPHYKKMPKINQEILSKLAANIQCGEVDSSKKWSVTKKDAQSLTPVLFSDMRITEDMEDYKIRITYLEINEINISSLKMTLKDKTKVYISPSRNDEEFQIDTDGLVASTKLNVILGKRSSGKTYTLEKIKKSFLDKNIKYIKQFELTENCGKDKFNELIKIDNNKVSENYLLPLKPLISTIINIDTNANDVKFEDYYNSLIDLSLNTEKNDEYSKTLLFNDVEYNSVENKEIKTLILSVDNLLKTTKYSEIIESRISLDGLKVLLYEFININRTENLSYKLHNKADEILRSAITALGKKSSLNPVKDIDFFGYYKNKLIIKKFNELIALFKNEKEIYSKNINEYKIIANRNLFKNASELKEALGVGNSLVETYKKYKNNTAYEYIKELKDSGIEEELLYKGIIKIEYTVLNKHGLEVSGGERAEFNLLKELIDAEKYDALLMDEPESSFDNPFIKTNIIQLLKDLSNKTTVFMVTHNNTLGTLIAPNKVIYTEHQEETNKFVVYSGNATDKILKSSDNDEISNYLVLIDTMEAGEPAYNERKEIYESLKN